MLVKSFFAWMHQADDEERASAVVMLADAYLSGNHGDDLPGDVDAALTSVLDDPAPKVRRALADCLADRPEAPRHIVIALAADIPDVSRLLVARSPVLAEADLIDLAITAEPVVLVAIALRQDVTWRIAHEIVARGLIQPILALIGNGLSEIADADLLASVDAFGSDARLREVIKARGELPAEVLHALMLALAHEAGESGAARLADATLQGATIAIAQRAGRKLPGFVAYLRARGHLTPALLLRSVLGGEVEFLAVSLADLCALDVSRVRNLLVSRAESAILAMLKRAQLPAFLQPVLVAAIRASVALAPADRGAALSLAVIQAAQSGCIVDHDEDGVRLLALLRRYETEAVRARSRELAASLRGELVATRPNQALLPLDIGPDMLRLAEPAQTDDEVIDLKDRRILRARGLVLDEPIPDLRCVIAEWKAEQEQAGMGPFISEQAVQAQTGNENEKPGRSRVA